jgi:hypothetical protein
MPRRLPWRVLGGLFLPWTTVRSGAQQHWFSQRLGDEQLDRADQPVLGGEAVMAGRQRRVDRRGNVRPRLGRTQFAHQGQSPVRSGSNAKP